MASLRVLVFDHEGRPVQFDTWLDDLQLYLLSDSKDSVSLFDIGSGAATAPPATADSSTRSQWLTRDAAARLAIRNHLPLAECAHFGQHRTAQALYDAVVARYSSPATAALGRLDDAWRCEFGEDVELPRWTDLLKFRIAIFDLDFDAILSAMYALSVSVEGDCYRCVPPNPGIAAAALGASESGTLPDNAPAEAFHTYTLDSGASRCFFRDSTTLTPLPVPFLVRLADPSGGPVVARSSTVLPCLAVPSGSLSGLHLPSFSTNLVSSATLQDAMVTTTTPGGQRVSICTCTRTGRHLATFTRRLGSSLYTLATEPPHVAASAQVSASGQVAATCSCRLLSHRTLLWHHRLGHPSLPRLRGMHSRLLTLPMDVWSQARVSGQSRERYFLLVVDDYTRYTTVFPLRSKGQDLPVLRLHSDRGGEFSSNLLRDFCRWEGILQSFTLPDSPQQNGIAERRIGLVMEVARTSMIHVAAPHFLWPFAIQYAAHQLNLWPRVSLPEISPTLRWTGEVGDASVFRVWGSRAFVRDMSADKLSPRAIPCVLLGFVPNAPSWQFYHPTSRRVIPSQDVTFDESVPFYHLFLYRSTLPPPPPLFLAPGPPPVDPLPPQGPAPSGVSQVDSLLGPTPYQVAVGSGAARGTTSGGASSGGGGYEGVETGGAERGGVGTGGAEPGGVGSGDAASEGVESGGAEPQGAATTGGSTSASPRLSLQQLREWFVRHARLRSGATGAGGAGAAGAQGAGVAAGAARAGGAGVAAGASAAGSGVGEGAGVVCPGAGGAGAAGAGAGGTGAGGTGAVDPCAGGAGGTVRPRPYFPASQLPAPSPSTEQSDSLTERREPASCPVSHVCTAPCTPCSRPPPVPSTHAMALPTASPLVAELLEFAAACRLDYAFALVAEVASASPPSDRGECALGTDVLEDRQEDFECLAAAVPRFASMLLAPEGDLDAPDIPTPRSYAEVITGPYSSQWQAAMDAEMVSWKSTGTYVDKVPPPGANIVDGMWIFRVKRPPGSPPAFKVRYVARGFSQRHFHTFSPTPKMTTFRVLLHVAAQHDYELHSLDFSTAFLQGSLHEEIWLRLPPCFTGTFLAGTQWSLRRPVYGLRQAPREWHDTLRTTLAALGFAPSTADPSLFLRTDTSLPPLYVVVYVDDLVFATTDTKAQTFVKSELQKRHTCTDLGELRSYLGLQITRDRARCTITLTQSHMVHQVLLRFSFQFSSPQPTPLSTRHSFSAPPLDESVEPSGPYPELVGCLMYLMTCTRPDLAYPLSLLARYVAPGRHRKVHWDAAKRVLRYLWSTSGMGLVLGGRGPVVLTGHADASWVDDSATQRSSQGYTFSLGSGFVSWRSTRSSSVLSSSCEAEIYARAMASQELRWLTYLLTDLGEQPRSPPVLNKSSGTLGGRQLARLVGVQGDVVLALALQMELDVKQPRIKVYRPPLRIDLRIETQHDSDAMTRVSRGTVSVDERGQAQVGEETAGDTAGGAITRPQNSALYVAVITHYSLPATAALGRLLLPYLFPELSAFATVEDLVSHLRTRDARYRTTISADVVAIGAARGTPRPPFFEGCSPSPLAPSYASAAAADVPVAEDVGVASASTKRRSSKDKGGRGGGGGKRSGGGGSNGGGGGSGGGGGGGTGGRGGGSGGGGGGSGGGGGGSSGSGGSGGGGTGGGRTGARRGGFGDGQRQQQQCRSETQSPQQLREWLFQRGTSGGSDSYPYVIHTGDRAGQTCGSLHTQHCCFSSLHNAWHAEFGDEVERPRWADLIRSGVAIFDLDFDVILSTMYALSVSAEGDCYRCVPPDPGIAAAALVSLVFSLVLHLLRPCTPSPWTQVPHVVDFVTAPPSLLSLHLSQFDWLTPPGAQSLPAPPLFSRVRRLLSGTTALVNPPCHACMACTPISFSLGFPGLCLPSHPRLLCPAFLASRGGSAPLLAPPCFPPRVVPFRLSTWTKGEVPDVLIPWIRAVRLQLHERFGLDLPVLRVHSDTGFMEVARTSMIHAAAPHILWPLVVRYAAHQLNLWPRVSLPETSPTLRWTGEVRDASVFRDVTFDKSVPFYRLFPYRSAPPAPPPLFLALSPPQVDPLPPQGPAPSGVSQVDPLPGPALDEVAVGSGAARGAESGGTEPQSAALSRGAGDARGGGAGVTAGAGGTGGAATAGPGGDRTKGTGASGTGGVGDAGTGGYGAGGAGAGGAGPAGGAGAVDTGGTVRPRPYFVPLLQQFLGVLSSASLTPPHLYPPLHQSQLPLPPASPLLATSSYTEQSGSLTERREPASRHVSPVRAARRTPRSRSLPVPGTQAMALCPSSVPLRVPLPAPPESSLPSVRDPEFYRAHATSPTVSRLLATNVSVPSFESAAASALVAELLDFAAACRLDYATALVAESATASPPSVGGDCALGMDVLEDRQEDFECLAAAVPRFASMLLAPEVDQDAPDIPTPRSYAQAITGPYSSQWQAAMDAEMASWKSTGTYVDEVPPPEANIVDDMWILRVKRPPGSPPAFKARYVARGFSQRQEVDYFQTFSPTPRMTSLRLLLHVAAQRDYELHSLDFSTAFLQGSVHEEIWLPRPLGFTGLFPAGTQWTTLAALGFAPSIADLLVFLRTDTSLPPFYVIVYVYELVFATTDIEFSSPQPTPLSTRHSLSAPPSYESVEPSGPYPELVGCLMYLMTCTRPDLGYPLSLMACYVAPGRHRYVAPGRHRKVHWDAAKRVLRYLCSMSGMGLVLGGRGPVVLTGHTDASWVDDLATQRLSQGYTFIFGSGSVSWRSTRSSSVLSSCCEAEIYAGAMAAQELRRLTYLLADLGEQPRSPPVLYVDNKATIALCQEHRLEHKTKHIALRYFLARELQQCGQLRLAYVATRAKTADIFTKALPPGDHQRFSTLLGLVPTLPHLLTA
ncbi:unnamed protein product [Closterium sp. NIES-54]